MERTRAERRYKTALIKKRVWARSVWNEISKNEETWSSSKRAFVPTDEEFVKKCKRRALRNEGKWRFARMKKFYGCGPDCWYCNPQIRCAWRESTIQAEINKLDYADFIEALS